jgi:hypothetical protein
VTFLVDLVIKEMLANIEANCNGSHYMNVESMAGLSGAITF